MFGKVYARYYNALNQGKPYEKEIKFVYSWSGKPKRIFDIGCGTGNYWKYYPKDVQIRGIDNSRSMAIASDEIIRANVAKFDFKNTVRFDCATALFDVINYIPRHDWWENLPIKRGGYFIFDIWDKKKVDTEGFSETVRNIGGITRVITPEFYDGRVVKLKISVYDGGKFYSETHRMYLFDHRDISLFCGKHFEIVDVKPTKTWQKWWKLRRI